MGRRSQWRGALESCALPRSRLQGGRARCSRGICLFSFFLTLCWRDHVCEYVSMWVCEYVSMCPEIWGMEGPYLSCGPGQGRPQHPNYNKSTFVYVCVCVCVPNIRWSVAWKATTLRRACANWNSSRSSRAKHGNRFSKLLSAADLCS